jgi:hypothetical protein
MIRAFAVLNIDSGSADPITLALCQTKGWALCPGCGGAGLGGSYRGRSSPRVRPVGGIVRDLYSYRSAFIGSTREALRAGIRAASIAIAINDGTTSK